jgi:ferredoxin
MRVVVDRDRCEGNAICVKIAPELFTLDDDDTPWSPPTPSG